MRKIIKDKNYFVFRDADGILGFTIQAYEGQQFNPRFLLDQDGQMFLLRRSKQIILLDALTSEVVSVLERAQRVRFFETPEDSSQIIRQYDVPITKIEHVSLNRDQIVSEEEMQWSHSA